MLCDELVSFLKERAADAGEMKVISLKDQRDAEASFGLSVRDVQMTALRCGICPSRYVRSVGTFGLDGQLKLLDSCAAVIGCGGLGGWIIEILARAGVGRMILIDGDTFEENNLNRQLYSTEKNMGKSKAYAAAERVRDINSAVDVTFFEAFANEENMEDMVSSADVVIDALDNNRDRRTAAAICGRLGIPFVHGAVGGMYGETALLHGGERLMWSAEGTPDKGEETVVGTPPFMPPFIASVEAREAIGLLAGIGTLPEKVMLWFDLENFTLGKVKLG